MKFLSKPSLTVISADVWWDARAYAQQHLSESDVSLTGDHAVADVELRWVGTDVGGNTRRLQVRKRGGKWR